MLNLILNLIFFSLVHDRMRYHPDDIGRRVPSAHQSSQTIPINIHII